MTRPSSLSSARAWAAACAAALALAGCGVGGAVSRTIGARCDRSDECDDRCLPPGAAFPGGFCSVSCEATADCPSDASCADVEAGVCLFDCLDDRDCEFLGPGWRCLEVALREDQARKVTVCLGG
jgi:hypothetical protein